MTLWEVDRVYQCAACVPEEQPVHHVGVHLFMRAASQFLRSIGELENSALWQGTCVEIRRARWRLGTVPLPLSSTEMGFGQTARLLATSAARLKPAIDAALTDQLHAVAQALACLGEEPSNPLAWGAMDWLSSGLSSSALVVVTNRSYQDAVVREFAEAGCSVAVGLVSDLTSATDYDAAAVVGPVGWLPPGVLSAPRTARLGVVRYDFYRESLEIPPLFDEGPVLRGTMPQHMLRRTAAVFGATSDLPKIPEPEEPLPTGLDAISLAQDAVAGLPVEVLRDSPTGGRDHVAARAAQLADGSYVLLPEESGVHKVLLVDPGTDDEPRVEAVDAASVSVGDFVVLRGESYYQSLVERADAALGDEAPPLRAVQRKWKSLLRDQISRHPGGRQGVAQALRARGATTANLDYWTSPWCIRTRRKEDFIVVMRYLGRSAEAQDAWAALDRIDRAHRSAGRSYAEAVQRAVSGDVWEKLWEDRWYDIPLDDSGSGARAALVEAVLPGQLSVSPNHLCRLRTPEVL